MQDFVKEHAAGVEDVAEYVEYVTGVQGRGIPFHYKSWADDGNGNISRKVSRHCSICLQQSSY